MVIIDSIYIILTIQILQSGQFRYSQVRHIPNYQIYSLSSQNHILINVLDGNCIKLNSYKKKDL